MFSPVAVFLFAMTLAELFVLVRVAGAIGVLLSAFALVGCSVVGVFALRSRGAGFFRATIAQVTSGQSLVGDKMADQALVLGACLLLVLPGFVSATLAVLLFVPPIRALVRPRVRSRVQSWTRPYQRFGRTFVDVDSVVVNDTVVDDSSSRDAHPPAQPELG